MERVLRILKGPEWNELWTAANVGSYFFADFNLKERMSDIELWRFCQTEGLMIVTANRNMDGPDSLEWALRTEITQTSLPVVTISDVQALDSDRSYIRRVAIQLLETIYDVETLRGSGRRYIP